MALMSIGGPLWGWQRFPFSQEDSGALQLTQPPSWGWSCCDEFVCNEPALPCCFPGWSICRQLL